MAQETGAPEIIEFHEWIEASCNAADEAEQKFLASGEYWYRFPAEDMPDDVTEYYVEFQNNLTGIVRNVVQADEDQIHPAVRAQFISYLVTNRFNHMADGISSIVNNQDFRHMEQDRPAESSENIDETTHWIGQILTKELSDGEKIDSISEKLGSMLYLELDVLVSAVDEKYQRLHTAASLAPASQLAKEQKSAWDHSASLSEKAYVAGSFLLAAAVVGIALFYPEEKSKH